MAETRAKQSAAAWFHYPWAWLVVAIPLLTIVAGFVTFYLASHGRDSLVSENYYRDGLAINRQTDRLRRAAELGIAAELDLGRNQAYMQISLLSKADLLPSSLLLGFHHPTLEEHDQQIVLNRVDDTNHYRVVRPRVTPGRWHVSLEPENREWRLQGRIQLPVESGNVRLAP